MSEHERENKSEAIRSFEIVRLYGVDTMWTGARGNGAKRIRGADGIGYVPQKTSIKTRLLLQTLELPNYDSVTHYPQLSLVVKPWATVGNSGKRGA